MEGRIRSANKLHDITLKSIEDIMNVHVHTYGTYGPWPAKYL